MFGSCPGGLTAAFAYGKAAANAAVSPSKTSATGPPAARLRGMLKIPRM
jgi:hypothetical protein